MEEGLEQGFIHNQSKGRVCMHVWGAVRINEINPLFPKHWDGKREEVGKEGQCTTYAVLINISPMKYI